MPLSLRYTPEVGDDVVTARRCPMSMKRLLTIAALVLLQTACGEQPQENPAVKAAALLKPPVDQGPNWFLTTRADYYTQDQGSRIMPLRWFRALKRVDPGHEDEKFLGPDGLSRYGYLQNNETATVLPVGFTTNGPTGNESVGMNCAACHTREIVVDKRTYRIDGGPAIVDFQSFLTDLDKSVGKVARGQAAFDDFAVDVLGYDASTQDKKKLYQVLLQWYKPYRTIVAKGLPPASTPWGPGRLDAVGMILNRLTGIDLGPGMFHVIEKNFRPSTAPTRYPFVWNAPIQSKTQWPGFADNGNDLLGLARNTGEVIGVFADFNPVPDPEKILKMDYSTNNSANTTGLMTLEDLVKKIGAPAFQWPVDAGLVKTGAEIFARRSPDGQSCADCHGIKPVKDPLTGHELWDTPLLDVGTDTHEYDLIGVDGKGVPQACKRPGWRADPGVLKGKGIPLIGPSLALGKDGKVASFNLLSTAVIGTIVQRLGTVGAYEASHDRNAGEASSDRRTAVLAGAFKENLSAADSTGKSLCDGLFKYEARVMKGIWAAAPYLHNGSVPTLADLLEPVANRPTFFQIGRNYDPNGKVGLAKEQTQFANGTIQTGCTDRNSGSSNCGHEFGVWLKPEEKKALLEYLKTL